MDRVMDNIVTNSHKVEHIEKGLCASWRMASLPDRTQRGLGLGRHWVNEIRMMYEARGKTLTTI